MADEAFPDAFDTGQVVLGFDGYLDRVWVVVADRTDPESVAVPVVSNPELTTSSGDHFNAGLGLARIAGLPPAAAVVVGNTATSYFVRTANQASLSDVRAFVSEYLETF